MDRVYISLFELQTKLKAGIEGIFPSRVWIRAEISALKVRSAGHCYMELSQSDESGLLARAQAVIWSSKYRIIAPYFESVTGMSLGEGMAVMAEVSVSYSQLYGLSLVVNDIDPSYSLGEKERIRLMTIGRLEQEGLMDMQKGLSLPSLPYCLAVISAPDAAGYRDFMKHLHENAYGFVYHTELFPALMQGAECPSSVIAALDAVMDSGKEFDAVLILRGGGGKTDLSCYDDYGLSACVAQFPLPVMTAIGHDQDSHVVDMVAWKSLKTPTALADEIIGMYLDEDAFLLSFASRLKMAFMYKINMMSGKLDLLESRIRSADPREILKRGYLLGVGADGVVVKKAASVHEGDRMSVMFNDGTVGCVVDKVELKG